MKEVVEAKKQEVMIMTKDQASLWQNDEVTSSDILIARILAMQGLSEFVTDGKAKFGDFVNSLDEKVVGGINKPLAFIPFYLQKLLKVSKEVNGKFELDRFEALTPINENLPWEDIEGNFKIRRDQVYNCFAVIPGEPLPVCISFKGKSKKAGKKLATQMYAVNVGAKKLPPCATIMSLTGKKEQNDKGTFIVLDVVSSGNSTPDQINECAKWIHLVKSGAAKVQEDDEVPEVVTQARASTQDLEF